MFSRTFLNKRICANKTLSSLVGQSNKSYSIMMKHTMGAVLKASSSSVKMDYSKVNK